MNFNSIKKCKNIYANEKLEDYMNEIKNKCEKYISIQKKLEKVPNDDFTIPNEDSYQLITKYSYTIKQ